jgi:hypothetical protein
LTLSKRHLKYLVRWDLTLKILIDLYFRIKRNYKDNHTKKALEDVKYWNDIKNKYKDQPGFVIGNGPSLKIDDLTKIHEKGFVSIASNKIFLSFDQTPWRPTIYTLADGLVFKNHSDNIHNDIKIVHTPSLHILKDNTKKQIVWKSLPCISFEIVIKYLKDRFIYKKYVKGIQHGISNDMAYGAYGGCTVTYNNIQIAMHLGLNPIYLIGLDHSYGKKDKNKEGNIQDVGTDAHFIKGYLQEGEKVNPAPMDCMTKAYHDARLYCEANDIKILNATRGGYLEEFRRISLDEIFLDKNKYEEKRTEI